MITLTATDIALVHLTDHVIVSVTLMATDKATDRKAVIAAVSRAVRSG